MIRLVIDVGSWTTKINMLGCGVVLSEATCVAVQGGDEEDCVITAYGDKARALSGKAALNTHIINPVCEGDVVYPNLLAKLLGYFLAKCEIPYKKARAAEVMFVLPCSADAALRETYKEIARECNIGRVYFTRTPFTAVLGHSVTLSPTAPVFSVDVGYGKTDVAVFSPDGIISGYTLHIGGGNIDVHIIDMLMDNFSLRIGALTAERLKIKVGSLLPDDYKVAVADGRHAANGAPASEAINSSHLEEVIKMYVDKIIEYTREVLSQLPAEVSSSVMRGGVYLSGGVTKIDGFADYFAKRLGIPVNVCDEPALASCIGGGALLSDAALCARLVTVD